MKAFIHVIRKDVGGSTRSTGGSFGPSLAGGVGKGACGQGEVCVRVSLVLSPPYVFFSWQKQRTMPISVGMLSVLYCLLGCSRMAEELI